MSIEAIKGQNSYFDQCYDSYIAHATWRNCFHLKSLIRTKAIEISPNAYVDLGSGDKSLLPAERNQRRPISFDLSIEMLKRNSFSSERKIVGRAEALPFKSNTIDLVYASQSLHYTELELAGDEIKRVLGSRGRLLLVHLSDSEKLPLAWCQRWKKLKGVENRKFLSADALKNWADRHGLTHLSSDFIHAGQWFSWHCLYEKYDAIANYSKQRQVREIFENAPAIVKKHLLQRIDDRGVYFMRKIAVLDFIKLH